MRKRIKRMALLFGVLILILGSLPMMINAVASPIVDYQTHIQNVGWEADTDVGWRSNGEESGTSGRGLRLEGIKIALNEASGYNLGITYQTHIQNIGWEGSTDRGWKNDGEMSGTSGLSYRLEAIQIELTGEDASNFDVYYQVHAENFGWLGWAKNGESAGTAGYGYRLEAIRIQIVPRGSGAPSVVSALPFYDKNAPPPAIGKLKVHFIDVGQADSILIQQGTHAMLIDAGNNEDSELVANYLSNQGVAQLDCVIGTHPHEDHIGGLDYVINRFEIEEIYLPEVYGTTKSFEDVMTAIQDNNLTISAPVIGEQFDLGSAECTILGPVAWDSSELNTYSIVIRVDFGENSFLFTGDAEAINESAMIAKGMNLEADVLKVGHHGSYTSTSQAFLDTVNPKTAVIPVGIDNDYGYPHNVVLNRLNKKGVNIFRTDLDGTIIATSDGATINFKVNQ
ncbi:MBL fold metallo-hydrolase [Acetobacterium sp.]|uniref:MBL fold metallo-hydrolase n=1 Tax=Acetobacterium sp. TaxID=1872094 RepID=UPI0035943864